MTIILKINDIYIYVKIPHIISEILTICIDYFLIFCDDLYDCKDDNMLLIYKYRKLNISENNVYTNKIQYEHYSLIPIEKWNNRILKCNHISNFLLKMCLSITYNIHTMCIYFLVYVPFRACLILYICVRYNISVRDIFIYLC